MPNRDFIDHDLYTPREEIARVKMGPGDEPAPPHAEMLATEGTRGVSELNLPLMARHKQAIDQQAAQNAQEIERLRQMQEDLEREKRELEDARRKQADFVKGRQEILDHLNQSLVMMERNELKAAQVAELLQNTRTRFRSMLDEISAIHEEEWTDDNVRERIKDALVRIDDIRMEYNKSMARVEAVTGGEDRPGEPHHAPVIFDDRRSSPAPERTLGSWFTIGLVVSLPVILTLVVLTALFLMHSAGLF
ncbi:MAG: hypothetical protein FJ221_14835 [Lentisphaerae bacterium]|nr:hypothetical protein [Lentisphaerota bacterium]